MRAGPMRARADEGRADEGQGGRGAGTGEGRPGRGTGEGLGLRGLLEGEAPVEDLGRVLGAGGEAGDRGAEDVTDEGAAVADRLEEESVAGRVGEAGLDAGGALVTGEQRVV